MLAPLELEWRSMILVLRKGPILVAEGSSGVSQVLVSAFARFSEGDGLLLLFKLSLSVFGCFSDFPFIEGGDFL